ncbi:hypothetical protein N7453_009851 [Penicillium expansum]|nr:hypothetical protein N7453_009851 [Penicillium expansum]
MDGGNPTRGNVFGDRNKACTSVQPVRVSGTGLIQVKVTGDGRKENEALEVRRSTGRSGGDKR